MRRLFSCQLIALFLMLFFSLSHAHNAIESIEFSAARQTFSDMAWHPLEAARR